VTGSEIPRHPDVHRPWAQWSEDQILHVAVAYSNPFRWRSRRELMNKFRDHMMSQANVVLHVGEVAYGDRPWEVTSSTNPNDLQLRIGDSPLFLKENIMNLVIRRFPPGWRYGAIIDADFTMTRHDWALEAVHQLQFYSWVQLFSSYADLSGSTLGNGYQPLRTNASFAYNWHRNGFKLPAGYGNGGWKSGGPVMDQYEMSTIAGDKKKVHPVGATGGAWSFTRSGFDLVGGLLDICICGHGDWFQTFGLVSELAPEVGMPNYTDGYRRAIMAWQQRAAKIQKNIGYIDNFAVHHFHGSKMRRFYTSRYKILIENNFDPQNDLVQNWQGVYQLAGNKPALRDAMRRYMLERSEDDMTLTSEQPII
jgi:hypothetical protein